MSLMLKLLSTIVLLSSFVYASTPSQQVEEFLEDKFTDNPRLKSVDVKVTDVVSLEKIAADKHLKGWNAYIIDVTASLNTKQKKVVKQRMIWFSNGYVITKELTDMYIGDSLTDLVKPSFKEAYYKKENLLFGNVNAKHKIAIFSDPLCPFCKSFVPGALEYMKKYPNKFAVYYFHFPLERIHPASATLVKAAAAAELQGYKDVVEKLYKVHVSSRERDVKKILAAFNKAEGTNITPKDLKSEAVTKQMKADLNIATVMMVNGTPTLYFDGKIDKSRKKYLKAE